ncbi:MAG: CAP domain-containing protein [Planctomycetota bacterium]|nr:CAP domain-containing protein [Planctomycetota bacterium]
MFTLQILDAGQTFLHSLDGSSVTFGSDTAADVQLRADRVAPKHARVEVHGERLLLRADAEVLVNGAAARAADLGLGDRVEIGDAVLVVGRAAAQTSAPASAKRATRATPLPPKSPRTARVVTRRSGGSKLLVVVVALVAIGVPVALTTLGGGQGDSQGLIAMVDGLRKSGKIAEARAESARLRAVWQDAQDDRLERLDEVDQEIVAVEVASADLAEQVLDPSDDRTYAQWLKALRGMEASGPINGRLAARKVRSRLRELVDERDERAAALAPATPRDPLANAAGEPSAEQPPAADAPAGGDSPPAAAVATPAVEQAEVDRRCDEGQFAQALALVQEGFESAVDADELAQLRVAQQLVRDRAVRAMRGLLAKAREAEAQGRLKGAATMLREAQARFPAGLAFRDLGREAARLDAVVIERERAAAQAAVAATGPKPVDQATRLQTLASLRSHMDKVRAAEDAGDYAAAAGLLREAAVAVRARDAEFADRLVTRAAESDLLAGWNAAVVAAVQAGKQLTTVDAMGRELELLHVEEGRIVARSADGDERLEWYEVAAEGMQRLAAAIKAKGRTALGLAALLYKNGEAEAAEEVLASLLRSDAKQWKQPVDDVLARGRGEELSSAGYELRKEGFVSLREVELEALGKKLSGKLKAAMRSRDPNARDAFVAETVAGGDLQREALGYAMREAFEKQLAKVASSSLKKQVDALTAERDELEAAREHAKELVFDEVQYFYPYKPPAVSGEKHAEYNRVQQEVDARIAALRSVWEGSKTRVKIPKKFGEDLDRVDWLVEQLGRLGELPQGESVATALLPIAWARALEPGETVTLKNFCLTPGERAQRAYWRQIRAYNEAAKGEWPVAVTTLLRITNDYRVMFGHRPLAAVASACAGSQGHADEMSKLGYFAHMSPTPGRKTPTDRMRLAGYMFGVSENIAMTGGAMSSHVAWCHSSGHHRNLLSPGHREIGIGANGRYWVQNFGSGDVHKSHPLWPAAADK